MSYRVSHVGVVGPLPDGTSVDVAVLGESHEAPR